MYKKVSHFKSRLYICVEGIAMHVKGPQFLQFWGNMAENLKINFHVLELYDSLSVSFSRYLIANCTISDLFL